MPSGRRDQLDLQLRRRRAGIDQISLAAALGVAQGTLSRFETGRRSDLPGGRGRKEYIETLDKLQAKVKGDAA